MKFKDRVSFAWSALTGRKMATVTTFSEVGWDNIPHYQGVSYANMVNYGYRKNELIFACISKTANTAAQVELEFYRNDQLVDNHPIKALIQKPNPYMSEFDFWVSVVIYQKLAGVAYYEKERSKAGKVVALWPLRPDWVTPIKSNDKAVKLLGYEYQPDGFKEKVTLSAEDVLTFPLWDPMGLFNFWPPAAVAARTGDVDNATTDYLKTFFEKGGRPPGIIKSTQRILDAEKERISAEWERRYGGSGHWTRPAILDADAEYQKVGFSFQEMGFDVLDARNEARICMVMDIPPILIGAKVGLDRATYSNYGEARTAWWEDSLSPMYENFLDVIENGLLAESDPGVLPKWNFERVNALQEDRNKRWTRATQALTAGGITVNEFCIEVGLEDKGPAGEYYLRGMGITEIPASTGIREPEPEPIENPGMDEEENEPVEEESDNEKSMKRREDKSRTGSEREWKSELVSFFEAQAKRVTREAARSKNERKLSADFWEEEDEELELVLRKLIKKSVLAGVAEGIALLMQTSGIGVDWGLVNQAALAWVRSSGMKRYTTELVNQINGTTKRTVESAIADWIQSGERLDELIADLAPTFGAARAEMIAVTEVTRTYAEGNILSWRESGFVKGKEWRTAEDELVCDICGPLAGMIVGLDENGFTTEEGGEGLTAPPAHVNCRCALYPAMVGE